MKYMKRLHIIYAHIIVAFSLCCPAAGQPMMRFSDSPSPILNHAFATQLGSGIYKIGEQSAYIYRLGTSVPVYKPDHSEWFIRLRFPVTVGFFNFQIKDVIDIGFPEKLATLSFVPTLELAIPLKDNWWLEPFAGIGGGRDFSTNTSSYI